MQIKKVSFPNSSKLTETNYDYVDSYSGTIEKVNDINSKEIGRAFFLSSPKWINNLLVLRNKIVSIFGLKTGHSANREKVLKNDFSFEKGNHIGLFKVYDISEKELILGEDDKHLNFKVSFLVNSENFPKNELVISTVVKYNNIWGKLYFLPVKPFHKVIVQHMLKKTIQEIGINPIY